MIEVLLLVIGALLGLGAGVWLGLRWGMRLAEAPAWRYWAANAVVSLAGLAVAIVGQFLGQMWSAVAGLGIMGGGITGLKYGYGRNPGVWAVHDRLMGIDDDGRDG